MMLPLRIPLPNRSGPRRWAFTGALVLALVSPATASRVEPVGGESTSPDRSGAALAMAALVGQVHDQNSPLAAAGVYAYRLADLSLRKVVTDDRGAFSFGSLPAGLYKIIAHKPGFLPAVVLLTRATASVFQELELELTAETFEAASDPADFWKIRERIPPDILREITIANADSHSDGEPTLGPSAFATRLQALQGYGRFGNVAQAQLTGGVLDMSGVVGDLQFGVAGSFRQLDVLHAPVAASGATSQALALTLDTASSARVAVSGQLGRLRQGPAPVDLERYDVSWSQDLGPGRSSVTAAFVDETNFYADTRLSPLAATGASRSWQLEGSYATEVGERNSLRTGIRYRERVERPPIAGLPWHEDQARFEVFGIAERHLQSAMSVQYGLVTTFDDSFMGMSPQAGLKVDLGDRWKAETSLRHRVLQKQDLDINPDFVPAYYRAESGCTAAERDCYRVDLTANLGDDNSTLRVGALYRVFDDSLRLYFSDDFFNQNDSLAFVRGDQVPELHIEIRHRLGPSISTRFESNLAAGGGGLIIRADRRPLENEVRYMVTSLDTRFEATDTDLLVAFHQLEQHLSSPGGVASIYGLELDRLRLLVTQALPSLLGLSTDWALRIDMQLSRGSDQVVAVSDDEIRRRIVGGIAVRF